jgi:hypothetical protein
MAASREPHNNELQRTRSAPVTAAAALAAELSVMRTAMIRATRTTAAIVVSYVLSGCVGPFAENIESHYPAAAAAQASGAISRGWIPEGLLPQDAVDVWEYHNIDNNRTWGCFRVTGDLEPVRRHLSTVRAERIAGPVSSGPRAWFRRRQWWPSEMAGPDVEAYRYAESARFQVAVGIVAQKQTVCFHRAS